MSYTLNITQNGELAHHGIKGMHWGVRRYQNADGTLTSAGRRRLNTMKKDSKSYGEAIANMERLDRSIGIKNGQKLDHNLVVPTDFIKTYHSGNIALQKIEKKLKKKRSMMT